MKLLKFAAIAIPVLFLGSCVAGFALWYYDASRPPEIAKNVESVDWLPAEATKISYYRSYVFTAYEFQISEAGFREWASTKEFRPSDSVEFQPVTEVSEIHGKKLFPIQRYNRFGVDGLEHSDDHESHAAFEKATTIDIRNGLRGESRRGSAGGYSIGYDRDTGTAYYQMNPR